MTRLLLSCATAAVLALPVLVQPAAAATTTAKPHKPAVHHTAHRAATTTTACRGADTRGDAAVDALNAQSLATARGNAAAR